MRIVAPGTAILIAVPLLAAAYKDGPAPNVTGGFGEPSCQECHFDQPLNDAAGRLSLEGVPERYEAGRAYRITVTLSRPGMTRGGFEIAARFASGTNRALQAGAWRALDGRVQIVRSESDPPVQFLQHNAEGSIVRPAGTARWEMEWIAPAATVDPVEFNVAGNASNDDASALGDYIYTSDARSRP